MRIVIAGSGPAASGLQKVFHTTSYECLVYDESARPSFDVFDEWQPRLAIAVNEPTRAMKKCATVHSTPLVSAKQFTEGEVFVDSFTYYPVPARNRLWADVSYVHNGTIDNEFERGLAKLCARTEIFVKLYGPTPLQYPQYLGPVSEATERQIYSSSSCCLVDSLESIIKVKLCMGVALSNADDADKLLLSLPKLTRNQDFVNARHQERERLLETQTYWQLAEQLAHAAGMSDLVADLERTGNEHRIRS